MAEAVKSAAAIVGRLKREDCNRTKHDSEFSRWQVLIGPSDWADYSLGKEGAARYRVHNLPLESFAGVYELGIAVRRPGSSRGVEKHDIVVVYLGQAENVRTRLQRYGRTGAHLEISHLTGHWNELKADPIIIHKGTGLFEEIFLRGHSIVFRWAAMKDKNGAEKTESRLLNTFDYAWNRGGNGARRPNEILQKLDRIASTTAASAKFKDISKRLMSLGHGAVGIKIEAITKPMVDTNLAEDVDDDDGKKFFARIFKFNRSKPRLVLDSYRIPEDKDNSGNVCGFIMVDGIPCSTPPIVGRKRCEKHKGMRIYGSTYVKQSPGTVRGANSTCSSAITPTADADELSKFTDTDGYGSQLNWKLLIERDDNLCATTTTCGASLVNGSLCRRRTGKGNERCWQHQGKSVNNVSDDGLSLKFELEARAATCGVPLLDGSSCGRDPVPGRKRCLLHKGMRLSPVRPLCLP
ncbi:Protein EFFECTOR OF TRANSCRIPTION 2 [Linum perenne]